MAESQEALLGDISRILADIKLIRTGWNATPKDWASIRKGFADLWSMASGKVTEIPISVDTAHATPMHSLACAESEAQIDVALAALEAEAAGLDRERLVAFLKKLISLLLKKVIGFWG